jgi:hypothetical protein
MEFNINDRVIEKETGRDGVVIDKMFSEAKKAFFYEIETSGYSVLLEEDDIEMFASKKEYQVETQIADNVVIGIIFEIDGDQKTEVCRGHAHIIHEGAEGIAQACAYAYKRAFMQIDSGIYMKQRRAK